MPAASGYVNEATEARQERAGNWIAALALWPPAPWQSTKRQRRRSGPGQFVSLSRSLLGEAGGIASIILAYGQQLKFEWLVLYCARKAVLYLPRPRKNIETAHQFQWEVTMETLLTGPIFYVLIAWGIVTVIFMLLLIRRSLLASHEDDQIFLDGAQEHMAREQRELIAKINTLSRPLLTSGIVSGVLLLVLAGMWLYNGLKSF
ncbi:MAG: hypothetical protein WCE61_08825 [Candidatus Acidiferrum sp.]